MTSSTPTRSRSARRFRAVARSSEHFDVVVVGLGAAGAATLHRLALRGARVLGVDQFSPPHAYGSSHGESRITRLAIGEGAVYTPLALRSHELWREIESQTGEELLTSTGGLVMASGAAGTVLHDASGFFDTTIAAAERYGIEHELLDGRQIGERFPQFGLTGDERGYYEPEAGFLRPEACVGAQLGLAERNGAAIRRGERVTGVEGGAVSTDSGSYRGDRVVLACGGWLPAMLSPELARSFRPYRQVLYWFEIEERADELRPGRCPVYIWEFGGAATDYVYGFPSLDGRTMKLAAEQYDTATDADGLERDVTEAETAAMFEHYVRDRFPWLAPRCAKSVVCPYTVTPDWDFVLDWHPEQPEQFIASPCSGHGFKHSAAIGETIAQTLLDGHSALDISPFALTRFD